MAKDKQCVDILSDIVSLRTRGDSDFEGLTELYRRIFMYLAVHSGVQGYEERAVEREIVAAFESVFPRVGLRTFVTLQDEDKAAQIKELSSIVFGIRLFNRAIGKGGSGIEDTPALLMERLNELQLKLTDQHAEVTELCAQYTMTINHMHRQPDSKGPPPRLRDELTNRRQYLACLQNLQDDCDALAERVDMSTLAYNEVMEGLQDIIGTRSSVSKEQVYPKFDALAKVWKDAEEDLGQVNARLGVLEALQEFKFSFNSRLRAHDVAAARNALELNPDLVDLDEEDQSMFRPSLGFENSDQDLGVGMSGDLARIPEEAEPVMHGPVKVAASTADETDTSSEPSSAGNLSDGTQFGLGGSRLLTFEVWRQAGHHLGKLSLNRFCPWTIAKRDALLLYGKPRLGVIEFDGQFYCCATQDALNECLIAMDVILDKVKAHARRAPELINLLKLQEIFPTASVAALVAGSLGNDTGKDMCMESGCQTDTHAIESHIDPSYEWNEWALRRRGVQLANLRQKRTHSTQTNLSHFRSETETQTWVQKEKEQNTLVDAKTQSAKMVSYMTGLRGRPSKQFSVVNMSLD
eukprot:TRINITY_DN18719_c0_g1_i3.p1 TRINITY_DN18719_c0_g1~~TRINITY_DN18719_c0_g1_i3.p1  ORF type:complete len:579 (+),score=151.62 TRINITY_DN18719_c0_g1_i3:224-1960(+)